MKVWDVCVLGAGAAGLMVASLLGQQGYSVVILERNRQVGRKILISGGGRCNFTNREVEAKHYTSANQHFAKSALSRYPSSEFINLVERYNIAFYEKKLGQLFCKNSAREIIDMLLSECKKGSVKIELNRDVEKVVKKNFFETQLHEQESVFSRSVVVATGGLSLPSLGSSDVGHSIARSFGMSCTELRPALVPFVLDDSLAALSGVSLPASIKIGEYEIEDDLLFTHKGLSGPVILKASLYWGPRDSLEINLLPAFDLAVELESLKRKKPKATLEQVLRNYFAQRMVEVFSEKYQLTSKPLGECTKSDLQKVIDTFHHWKITPKETEGYRKAEVTRGGVSTDELSSKTMEAKKVPGLYFIGEVVDVTGLLGGYNFQWAWASAYALAQEFNLNLDEQ
jgi:predicted Rossmann fold flavoprotein